MSDVARGAAATGSSENTAAAGRPEDAVEQARRWLADHGVPIPDEAANGDHGRPGPDDPDDPLSDDGARSARPGRHTVPSGSAQRAPIRHTAATSAGREPSTGHRDDALDPEADPVALARTIVLRKLAAQARTRAELSKALKAKDVPDHAANAVLDRMEEVGLIDDQGFAQDWVESRQLRRHLSRTALRRELITKGVDRDEIEVALEQVDSHDELAAARSLVAKKARAMAGLDGQVRYRRLAGMLGRRGFGPGVIGQVLGDTLDQVDG